MLSLFCYALLCVHSSFAIILMRKIKLVALLLLSYKCIVAIIVLWLFLTVLWVGLQYVTVVFPNHTHLLFDILTLMVGINIMIHFHLFTIMLFSYSYSNRLMIDNYVLLLAF